MDGIEDRHIQESLDSLKNNTAVFKAGQSQGKSGSFFFFSHDRKFIIKTMYQEELEIMMEKLGEYYKHIQDNPNSIIARFYGVFQVEMESIVPVNLLLQANSVQLCYPESILDKIYDLKGSWNNRIVVPGENQTKKDRNFLQCKKSRLKNGEKPLVNFHPDDI